MEAIMRIFTVFPLMAIPVAIYNVIALSGSNFSTAEKVCERMLQVEARLERSLLATNTFDSLDDNDYEMSPELSWMGFHMPAVTLPYHSLCFSH